MLIVEVRDARTNYALYADFDGRGDLVVSGTDRSPGLEERMGFDEYEYFYRIRAAEIPELCNQLGAPRETLLDGLRDLLAPSGASASSAWRKWLESHQIGFEFSVR